jgi:Tol biopolymer transport system component
MKPLVLALSVVGLVFVAAACGGNDGAKSAGPVPNITAQAEPAAPAAAEPATPAAVPEVDYVIDLDTGVTTALPENIIQSVKRPANLNAYAASSDGSRLAYVAKGDDGRNQIFVADIDGTDVRQVTHDPYSASFPAWSPDGRTIAYVTAPSSSGVVNAPGWLNSPGWLRVVDVATGESTQMNDLGAVWSVQFTPDGSSLLYTASSAESASRHWTLRTLPVAGGKSTLFIGPDGGLDGAGSGSISPDGSLVTYWAGGESRPPDDPLLTSVFGDPVNHCGGCWIVANVDGTARRALPCYGYYGAWSPDSSRVVCGGYWDPVYEGFVTVVDVATGLVSRVAEGKAAIWLDDHTLLVEVPIRYCSTCSG